MYSWRLRGVGLPGNGPRGFAADVLDRSEGQRFLHGQAAPKRKAAPVAGVERGDVHNLGLEGIEAAQS